MQREIPSSERNCEAKWKYTGRLWPLEYNVDYEKLEHHRAQQVGNFEMKQTGETRTCLY